MLCVRAEALAGSSCPDQCLEGLSRLTSVRHWLDLCLNQQCHSGKNTSQRSQRLPQTLCCKEEPSLRRPPFERLGCDVALSCSSLAVAASGVVVRNLALSMLECRVHWHGQTVSGKVLLYPSVRRLVLVARCCCRLALELACA